MRINGDLKQIGAWNKGDGPIKMERGEEMVWLTGQKVRPWEYKIRAS